MDDFDAPVARPVFRRRHRLVARLGRAETRPLHPRKIAERRFEQLRDGHRALALATDACRQTEYKQDYILSTLAAAYAETGDFESARKWAAQAVEVKPSPNAEPSRKDELKKELDSYKANKPWREALPLPQEKALGEKKTDDNNR